MLSVIDGKGLTCSQIILRIITKTLTYQPGDVMEVRSDTPGVEAGLKEWCARTRREIVAVRREGDMVIVQIKF